MSRITARYNGRCFVCGDAIEPGKDLYDLDTKKALHAKCEPTGGLPLEKLEAEAVATMLGFVAWDPNGLDAEVFRRWRHGK